MTFTKEELIGFAHLVQGISKISLVICPTIALWTMKHGGLLGGLCSVLFTTGTIVSYDALQTGKRIEKNPNVNVNIRVITDWTKDCYILRHITGFLSYVP